MGYTAVSIIVPVYNAEHFLRKGLDSCINQTLQNIEVICVNDASIDGSSLIVEEYVDKYPDKVVLLNCTENIGQGGARNQGILHARGEYLCFMDSDDYLDIHLCEEVYKKAKEENADMVFYDYIRVSEEKRYHVEPVGEEELGAWYQQVGCAPWQQMIKRDIILEHELFLPEKIRADDDAVVPLWRYFAKKRCKMHKPYYFYVNRRDSLVNEIKLSSVMSPIINVIPYRYKMMKRKGLLNALKAESDWMIARDISITLRRLMKMEDCFTAENILSMHQRISFLKDEQFDRSIIKYYLPCWDMEMVEDFLYYPNVVAEKYGDYKQYIEQRNKKGFCRSIERDIKDILLKLQNVYGTNLAVWGAGRQGLPIISTLYRMECHVHVYDNARYGEKVLDESDEYVKSYRELNEENISAVLVTSDEYYREIEGQIHESYPNIAVVNFMRMIRVKAVCR